MTTRATLANGDTFDYDEETEAHPTHVNDQLVVARVFTGPTPPKVDAKDTETVPDANETVDQRRARLLAELAGLDGES